VLIEPSSSGQQSGKKDCKSSFLPGPSGFKASTESRSGPELTLALDTTLALSFSF
jgi:hypothetical protein